MVILQAETLFEQGQQHRAPLLHLQLVQLWGILWRDLRCDVKAFRAYPVRRADDAITLHTKRLLKEHLHLYAIELRAIGRHHHPDPPVFLWMMA